jgi:hypothetical protein
VQEGNFYEVLDGLQGTESLAASSLNEITSGMKVTVSGGPQRAEGALAPTTPPEENPTPAPRGSGNGARRGDGGNE